MRLFRTSVRSGIDAVALRRENFNFNGVSQDKWGSAEMATGVCDCGYGRMTGTGTGVLRAQIQAYVWT